MHGRAHWVWDRNACNDQGHSQGVKHQITASGIYHLPFFLRVGFEPVTHLLDCKQHISYFSFVSQWIENTLHNFTFLLVVDCGEKRTIYQPPLNRTMLFVLCSNVWFQKISIPRPPMKNSLICTPSHPPSVFLSRGSLMTPPPPRNYPLTWACFSFQFL